MNQAPIVIPWMTAEDRARKLVRVGPLVLDPPTEPIKIPWDVVPWLRPDPQARIYRVQKP